MPQVHLINESELSLDTITSILDNRCTLQLSNSATEKIDKCRTYLNEKIKSAADPIYGVNTGFGSLYDRNISDEDLENLQENLVMSHACGMGERVSNEVVRLMLLLKIQSLAYGHSGVQVQTVERLVRFFNDGITPIVYEMGSLGASGDLAPLAHLSLPLIGKGEVEYQNKIVSSETLNQTLNLSPISFQAKEGLALLNGTQFMSAYGIWSLIHSKKLIQIANAVGALSLDTFDGRIDPFLPEVHQLRPQKGQVACAREVKELLNGSEIIAQPKKHVQDPYSFRCIPQVHGATIDTWNYAHEIFYTEVNSVTDNPNVFPDTDRIISAGNFHGQPLALALDFLCIALAELGSISERRSFQLLSGARQLPNYLVANPGINSGLMITQYTAASIVSQNKQLCTPASADSIVSSNGQEDHVSMGANSAVKIHKVIQNVYRVLAIELMTAAQALEFRRPANTSDYLEEVVRNFRTVVPFIENDRVLHIDMEKSVDFLKTYQF
ncbi:MAG: histidine ammonia-lyase [Bacteroidota bacterium]